VVGDHQAGDDADHDRSHEDEAMDPAAHPWLGRELDALAGPPRPIVMPRRRRRVHHAPVRLRLQAPKGHGPGSRTGRSPYRGPRDRPRGRRRSYRGAASWQITRTTTSGRALQCFEYHTSMVGDSLTVPGRVTGRACRIPFVVRAGRSGRTRRSLRRS
jgi:hypothetical protein